MSYRVRLESFEGPFDLLLHLVSRQKVAIESLSLSAIVDQYLEEVHHMHDLDLDVASDFLLVASTLLEIKAASLIPRTEEERPYEEYEELDAQQLRDALVDHLVEYKKFKNAAAGLAARLRAESHVHVRSFGPDKPFLSLMPDYLKETSLDQLGQLCAVCLARREVFLLESEHIAARAIPVETQVRAVFEGVKRHKKSHFSDFVSASDDPYLIVVTFLAVLELFKRNMIQISQDELFGDISLDFVEGSHEQLLDNEWYDSAE